MRSLRVPAILASGILLLSALPQVDLQARAAFANPKSTSMTISVDGTASDLTPTWIDSGVAKEAAFGGGDIGPRDEEVDGSTNELTTMYTTKSSGDTSRALLRNMAQGGVKEITCAAGYVNGAGVATSKEYYQRSQVTLGNLPTDAAKRVWAFYDANVGSGSGIKEIPHFNHVAGDPDIENARIAATANLTKLCDGTTLFVAKADDSAATAGTLDLGAARTTAGVYQDEVSSTTSVSFNVYVPMDASDSDASTIQLALGFVIDMTDGDSVDGSTLDDTTTDVAIETTIYAKPWWATAHGEAGHGSHPEHDEVHEILPACGTPAANDVACVIQADSGVFDTDGTTRLDAGATTGTSVVLTWLGDAENFEARLDLAPISPISTGGFSVPADKVSRISVSWPTSGTHYDAAFGSGDDQVNFLLAVADTPVLVNPASSASDANKWSVTESSSRIITTLNGTTRSTSSGISRDTWWPQCNVGIDEANVVTAEKCGEAMTGSVTASEMVFSSVPATVNLMVSPNASSLAGGLVSTNGQGFAFGPETYAGTSFQFAVAGPSYTSAGASRSTDGFYYVCVPATFLAGGFETTAADAAANWQGTRDGAAATTSFTTGTCGIGDTGLVASLPQFGYSKPLFRLLPVPVAAASVARPYIGPTSLSVGKSAPANGNGLAIGDNLDSIDAVFVGGLGTTFEVTEEGTLTFAIPNLDPGNYAVKFFIAENSVYLTSSLNIVAAAPAASSVPAVPSVAAKVNAGSFKGYVAIYARGHEGKRLTAKVGKDWVIVPSIPAATGDLFRVVEFTGAGYEIRVRIYIDRVLIETIDLTTK